MTVVETSIGEVVALGAEQGSGIEIGSLDAERFLLPIIGPTTFMLARLAVRLVEESDEPWIWFPVSDLARMLGVKSAVVLNSLHRAQRFGVASFHDGTWAFNCQWQPRQGR